MAGRHVVYKRVSVLKTSSYLGKGETWKSHRRVPAITGEFSSPYSTQSTKISHLTSTLTCSCISRLKLVYKINENPTQYRSNRKTYAPGNVSLVSEGSVVKLRFSKSR